MKYPKTTILILLLFVFFITNYLADFKFSSTYSKLYSSVSLKSALIEKGPEEIKILAFGDVMLGRYVETLIARGEDMFENIKGVEGNSFTGRDYIIVNLENPITNSEVSLDKEINLKMSPLNIQQLIDNKINLVSLANNHTEDYLQPGIDDTIKYLDQYKIGHFGIQNQPLIEEKNGIKLAFFGINALWGNIQPFYKMIEETKDKVDYIIVYIHWGDEYTSLPSFTQIQIGHKLIDAGTTIILGSHPHTTQPIEKYSNGIIFYSLGNFIFDQLNPITKKELGVEIDIKKDKIDFRLLPMTVVNFKPEFLSTTESSLECLSLTPEIKIDGNCSFSLEINPN